MKIRNHWSLYLLLLAFAVLGVRLAWTLARSTTGWKPHLDRWAHVATSLVGIETTCLSDKDPEAQAKFWLKQVSHVESADDDPWIAMGAAWMLDAPQFGFIKRHVRMTEGLDFPGIPASRTWEVDDEAIGALTEDFELLCRSDCLAKIDTATRLDSENVELWRARALLVFRKKYVSFDLEPRRDDWPSVLNECAEHDPDNALYDYLAALYLWSSSAEYGSDDNGHFLKIEDDVTFDQGNDRLTAGLAKPHLKSGRDGYAATMAFLDESSVARLDHLTAAGSRRIDGRATDLMFLIMRWQIAQLDAEKRKGNFDAAIATVRKVLRISDQVTEAGNYPNLFLTKLSLRHWGLMNLQDMNEDHPNLLEADEAEKVSVEFGQVQLDLKVLEEVIKRLVAKAGNENGADQLLAALALMVMAQMLVIVALGLALLSGFVARVFGAVNNDERVEMGWLRSIVAWLVGVGVSFVLLGMFPTEIVSPSAQTWLLCGLIWVGFALLVMGLLHLVRKRFQLPWTQLTVLAAITALPLVVVFHLSATVDLGVTAMTSLHPVVLVFSFLVFVWLCWKSIRLILAFARTDVLTRRRKCLACSLLLLLAMMTVSAGTALAMVISDQIEVQTWISPTVWKEAEGLQITPGELQIGMKLEDSKWVWAFIQWQAHHGALAAPLIAVGVLLIWHLIRRARRVEGGYREILRSQKRSQIRQAGNVVARSCVVASLVFCLVYLGATPTVADSTETYHRIHYERLVNRSHTWDEIEAETAQIKSDESLMTKLRATIAEIAERDRQTKLNAEIAERDRQIAEQERGPEE